MVDPKIVNAIQLSIKEQELEETMREIRRCTAIINSVNIKSEKYKEAHRKELLRLDRVKEQLLREITERSFLS